MDIKKIKSFVQFISKLDVKEINIEIENIKIYIKNNQDSQEDRSNYDEQNLQKDRFLNLETFNKKNLENNIKKRNNNVNNQKINHYLTIKSPMIGTFYRKPHPDQPPFVKIGDQIKIGMKVCIIEAMKLFNDIESEVNGKLIKIFVKDSTPVDYDQPLFLLEPDHKNVC